MESWMLVAECCADCQVEEANEDGLGERFHRNDADNKINSMAAVNTSVSPGARKRIEASVPCELNTDPGKARTAQFSEPNMQSTDKFTSRAQKIPFARLPSTVCNFEQEN